MAKMTILPQFANKAKHNAMREPIKVGKYGENDNFATFANKVKHKAIRGPIKVGDTGEFGKYGENDNFARIANRAWNFTYGLIYNGYYEIQRIMWSLPMSARLQNTRPLTSNFKMLPPRSHSQSIIYSQ